MDLQSLAKFHVRIGTFLLIPSPLKPTNSTNSQPKLKPLPSALTAVKAKMIRANGLNIKVESSLVYTKAKITFHVHSAVKYSISCPFSY